MAPHDRVEPGDDPGHVTVEAVDARRGVTGVLRQGGGALELGMAPEAGIDVTRLVRRAARRAGFVGVVAARALDRAPARARRHGQGLAGVHRVGSIRPGVQAGVVALGADRVDDQGILPIGLEGLVGSGAPDRELCRGRDEADRLLLQGVLPSAEVTALAADPDGDELVPVERAHALADAEPSLVLDGASPVHRLFRKSSPPLRLVSQGPRLLPQARDVGVGVVAVQARQVPVVSGRVGEDVVPRRPSFEIHVLLLEGGIEVDLGEPALQGEAVAEGELALGRVGAMSAGLGTLRLLADVVLHVQGADGSRHHVAAHQAVSLVDRHQEAPPLPMEDDAAGPVAQLDPGEVALHALVVGVLVHRPVRVRPPGVEVLLVSVHVTLATRVGADVVGGIDVAVGRFRGVADEERRCDSDHDRGRCPATDALHAESVHFRSRSAGHPLGRKPSSLG